MQPSWTHTVSKVHYKEPAQCVADYLSTRVLLAAWCSDSLVVQLEVLNQWILKLRAQELVSEVSQWLSLVIDILVYYIKFCMLDLMMFKWLVQILKTKKVFPFKGFLCSKCLFAYLFFFSLSGEFLCVYMCVLRFAYYFFAIYMEPIQLHGFSFCNFFSLLSLGLRINKFKERKLQLYSLKYILIYFFQTKIQIQRMSRTFIVKCSKCGDTLKVLY